jgi:hypothetical protein
LTVCTVFVKNLKLRSDWTEVDYRTTLRFFFKFVSWAYCYSYSIFSW